MSAIFRVGKDCMVHWVSHQGKVFDGYYGESELPEGTIIPKSSPGYLTGLGHICRRYFSHTGRGSIAHRIRAMHNATDCGAITKWGLYRHNLSREECKELGQLVRRHCNDGEVSTYDIADWLNDADASGSIVSRLDVVDLSYGECGHFHETEDSGNTRTGTVCQGCIDQGIYEMPENSSVYYHREDLYEHSDGLFYTYPEESEDEDEDEDEEGPCSHNLLRYSTNVLHTLNANIPASSANGPFTIGVELEVHSRKQGRAALVDSIHAQAADTIICKRDGSLDGDRGAELVSVPMYYQEAVDLFSNLEFPEGTTAWDAKSCGLHVHIDSRAFTKLSAAKFLAFWNLKGNAKFIRAVAGRHPDYDDQAETYAARVDAYHLGTTALQAAKYHAHGDGRYRLVNLCNLADDEAARLGVHVADHQRSDHCYNTLELRIFRASLKRERMLAQIEFAAASVYFARDASCADVSHTAFMAWLNTNTAFFPHLASFLKARRALRPIPGRVALADETVS